MIPGVLSGRGLSRLDQWWQAQAYRPNPFPALSAEDDNPAWLEKWHQPAPWPSDRPRTALDSLDAVVAWGKSGLVAIWGKTGVGKTFYRRLAAQTVTQDPGSRGALEITSHDLSKAGFLGGDRSNACSIARCICEKIASSAPAANAPQEAKGVREAAFTPGPGPRTPQQVDPLLEILEQRFGESDLRSLCHDLGVNYEHLGGRGTADAARELLEYLKRRHRLDDLLVIGAARRPDIDWPKQSFTGGSSDPRAMPPCPDGDDLGRILAHCGDLAASFPCEQANGKLYVFVDGLDKVYDQRNRDNRATFEAILEFIRAVEDGACGEHLAIRVFLPADLKPAIIGALRPRLIRADSNFDLVWDVRSVQEVAETRLTQTWVGSGTPPARHLDKLLHQNAIDDLVGELRKREREGVLGPRCVIEALSVAANFAAYHNVGEGPISGDVYRRAQQPPPCLRWLTRLLQSKWLWTLLAAALLLLMLHSLPISSWLARLVVILSQAVAHAVSWLTGVLDTIEAILLLAAILAIGLFMAWCLWRSFRADQRVDVRGCLRHAWRFLWQRLPWSE